jgi:mRNA interferase MazF
MARYPKQFQVYLVSLDPTIGVEIKKTRPCVVISPNEMNQNLKTVIVAPMTTRKRDYPTRINCRFEAKNAQIALDQIRSVDRSRLIKLLGIIQHQTQHEISRILVEMFEL